MRQWQTLLATAIAVAACSTPGPAAGQPAWNQLGIYSSPTADMSTANIDATANVPFFAYLVLAHPTNLQFDGQDSERPVTALGGFSARILFPADPAFFVLSETFPPGHDETGERPDYLLDFSTPVPVADNAVVLCTWQAMVLNEAIYGVFLAVPAAPSLPGAMAMVDADDPDGDALQEIQPSSGNFQVPVFSVNGLTATASAAWGTVKALYR